MGSEPDAEVEAEERARALRSLPSVNQLAELVPGASHGLAVSAARAALAQARERIARGEPAGDLAAAARAHDAAARAPGPHTVLNATGVIVHTNLGRGPLAEVAADRAREVALGYSDLEYDLERGGRGSRQQHVERLLCELTGAPAALVVNNCAAAVLLAAGALCEGRRLVVSRGQLVEIGGSFRIPEIVAQAGAELVEVGTTNRTRPRDYERAVAEGAGAVLWVHPSNFRVLGFVEEVGLELVCRLGAPVIADIGSGVLAEGVAALADEPHAREAVAAGAAVVCFSGDKLLGGPQAGVLVGAEEAIERCRKHPLARALRIDKLSVAALAATLSLYRDPELARAEIPVLRMLTANGEELRARAEQMRAALSEAGIEAALTEASGKVGGGALPLLELSGPVCAVSPGPGGLDALASRLRSGDPPVVARVRDGRLLLDPRALSDDEGERVAAAVVSAFR